MSLGGMETGTLAEGRGRFAERVQRDRATRAALWDGRVRVRRLVSVVTRIVLAGDEEPVAVEARMLACECVGEALGEGAARERHERRCS